MDAELPWPVSCKNDFVVSYSRYCNFDEGALMAVEVKKKLELDRHLRQATLELLLFAGKSRYPCVQVVACSYEKILVAGRE